MAPIALSRPSRLLSLLLIFFATLHTFVAAQTVLDSSKLPSCYSQCQPLTQANTACVPPAAPQTDQGTYQSCFCSSQFLVTLYSTPTLQNCNACNVQDLQQIQTWYESLCHDGTVVTPAAAATTAKSTGTSTTGASSSTTNTAASQSSGSSSATSSSQPKGWFSTHWKWVVLLIVLFLAFVFFLTFGFWFKRRQRRRRDNKRFSGTGQLRTANSPSPFASGILAPSDGAYIGSRNHPPMSAVPGAGSAAAMERYGSGSHLAYTGYGSDPEYDVPSPPVAAAGATRNVPWMSRNNSGGSGQSKRGAGDGRVSPVSPVDHDEIAAVDNERQGRKSRDTSLKKKLSRKSKSGSRRRGEAV